MNVINRTIQASALLGSLALAATVFADGPFLETATYAGGPGNDVPKAMDIGPDGSIFIAGYTTSPDLPNAIGSLSGSMDVFVMKLSGDMTTLYWSAYIGGVGEFHHVEFATDCAATADGGVVVTGRTETPDFPTLNALDDTLGGSTDAFLFKLDGDGNLIFSTFIGGSGEENAADAGFGKFMGEVEVAPDGSIFLAGNTRSADFPLVNPIDGTHGGFQPDVFFMKISADGQTILASTFLGDEFRDEIWGMRLDAEGRPVIVGNGGPGWPYTQGAYSFGTPSSSGVVYVTKLAADALSIEWSARLDRVDQSGGHLTFTELDINRDGDGTITVAGDATGGGFPVPPDAYQPNITSGSPTRDAIALSFSADGTQLTAGTFLGVANVGEVAPAVGVDSFGQILLPINIVSSPPRPNRFYKFNPEMTALVAGPSLFANPGQTQQVRIDEMNNYIGLAIGTGDTTPGVFQEQHPGGGAAYIARWDMQDPPTGASPAELVDFQVVFGTHVSGGLAELLTSDDQYLRTRSAFGFTASEPNVMELRIGAQTNVASPSTLAFTIESRLNNPGGVARIRLRNFSNNLFEQIHQYAIGTTEETVVIENVNATNRVRETDGRIEMSIRHVVLATFSLSGFDSYFDWIQIGVE